MKMFYRMRQARHIIFVNNRMVMNWQFENGFYIRLALEIK